MAGGVHAEFVVCMECGAKAQRVHEGSETDQYRCPESHAFSLEWAHSGPPTEPQWPPSDDMVALLAAQGIRVQLD